MYLSNWTKWTKNRSPMRIIIDFRQSKIKKKKRIHKRFSESYKSMRFSISFFSFTWGISVLRFCFYWERHTNYFRYHTTRSFPLPPLNKNYDHFNIWSPLVSYVLKSFPVDWKNRWRWFCFSTIRVYIRGRLAREFHG